MQVYSVEGSGAYHRLKSVCLEVKCIYKKLSKMWINVFWYCLKIHNEHFQNFQKFSLLENSYWLCWHWNRLSREMVASLSLAGVQGKGWSRCVGTWFSG